MRLVIAAGPPDIWVGRVTKKPAPGAGRRTPSPKESATGIRIRLAIREGFPLLQDYHLPDGAAVPIAMPPSRKATGSASGPTAPADDPGTRG